MTTQLWYVADVPLPTSKEQRTQIPRYKNRQTNASHHGNQAATHTKPKLINRVGSANEEEELKTKNQRNKQTRGGDLMGDTN